jgi:acyl carrier protein
MRDRILALVRESYRLALAEAKRPEPEAVDEETRLVGDGAAVDSLGLVALILGLEERLSDQLGLDVSIMDERALSRSRSPFRTVGSLTDYVVELAGAGAEPA